MTKEEMVLDICERLSEKDKQFTMQSSLALGLLDLPEEKIQIAYEYDMSNDTTFNDVYEAWTDLRVFKFAPYIINGVDEKPLLYIDINRYVKFCGDRFKVFRNRKCTTDIVSGMHDLSFIKDIKDEEVRYLMLWAGFLDTVGSCRNVYKYFEPENNNVYTEFINKSINTNIMGWNNISHYIIGPSIRRIDKARNICKIMKREKCLGLVAVGTQTVEVQTKGGVRLIFVPECISGDLHCAKLLAVMLLTISGIGLTKNKWIRMRRLRTYKISGYPEIYNLHDIDKLEIDQF